MQVIDMFIRLLLLMTYDYIYAYTHTYTYIVVENDALMDVRCLKMMNDWFRCIIDMIQSAEERTPRLSACRCRSWWMAGGGET